MPLPSTKPILILDGDTIPALTIARSLGQQGITVHVASHQQKALCSYSKHVSHWLDCPNPLEESSAFLEWLEPVLQQHSYDLIIPVTERTLVPITRQYGDSPFSSGITIPDKNALEIVLDKGQSEALAKSCDVKVPDSWNITGSDELETLAEQLSYPIVLKPGRSISDTAERVQLTVKYAHNQEQLLKIGRELLKHTHVVIQEYFTGTGIGIELIARQGEILYAFQHQRLHEMPLTGGGSSYRKSTTISPELLAASERLIKALNWHGVAMVEFKVDLNTGDYIFIEINGRFWGSLPLAAAAGADFPYMLYELYTKNGLTENTPYRPEVSCRKLSSDIAWFEAVIRKDGDPDLVTFPSAKSAIRDMLCMFRPNDYLDVQSFKDPKPGLIDIKNILKTYSQRFTGRLAEKKQRKEIIKQSSFQTIERHLSTSQKVLFVCYGNINRSAAAHVLAEERCGNTQRFSFASAGFHPVADRPADPRMCLTAKDHGIDMERCRSTILTAELIDWADVIFVMETDHITKLATLSEAAVQKTFLLGGLHSKKKTIEILDPYNKQPQIYQQVYGQIDQAINMLKSTSA